MKIASRQADDRGAKPTGLVVVLFLFLLSAMAGAQTAKYPQTIVFMTDFGVVDDSVAICRGVMYSIMPEVRIVDLTHQVTPFSILDGARFLYGASPYYPAGTVFVVVVDPTVGSSRKAIVAKSKRGQYFVLPDNGVLTLVEQRDGIEAVHEITNTDWMIGTKLSSTFHGRASVASIHGLSCQARLWPRTAPGRDRRSRAYLWTQASFRLANSQSGERSDLHRRTFTDHSQSFGARAEVYPRRGLQQRRFCGRHQAKISSCESLGR